MEAAISAGATMITICDTAGTMMPDEFKTFIEELYHRVPTLSQIVLSVQCADALNVAAACSIQAVQAGARQY